MGHRSWALALVAGGMGCGGGPSFVERPGDPCSRSGSLDPSMVPPCEIVQELAGCTWTQTDPLGQRESWRYDRQGRLVEHVREMADAYRAVSRWRGWCRVEQRWLALDGDEPARTAFDGYNVQYTSCDRRGNPVWRDDVVATDGGEEWVIASRSFVNDYAGTEQLVQVERWSEPGPGAERDLLDTTEYVWHDELRPLRVRFAQPGSTSTITTTYWWDHELLLGTTISGAGSDIDVVRTFERRRLVSEVITAGDQEVREIVWSFRDDGARFPYAERRVAGTDITAYELTVDCP